MLLLCSVRVQVSLLLVPSLPTSLYWGSVGRGVGAGVGVGGGGRRLECGGVVRKQGLGEGVGWLGGWVVGLGGLLER